MNVGETVPEHGVLCQLVLVEAVCNTVILTDPLKGMWPGPVEECTLPTFFKSTGPTGGQRMVAMVMGMS